MTKRALKFRVGARYVTRNGAVVKIARIHGDARWPFLVGRIVKGSGKGDYNITFCPDGRYWRRPELHGYDLIAEEVRVTRRAA